MRKLTLSEVLEGIEDTRRTCSVMYPLHEVLIIMLLAVICGATSYAKVEMFGKSKQEWLKTSLKLEYGIPDACTFRNIIKEINTKKLHTLFCALPAKMDTNKSKITGGTFMSIKKRNNATSL